MRDARAGRETSRAAQGALRQSKWQSPEVVAGLQKRASRRKSGRHLHLREAAIREQFCSRNIAAVVGGEKYDSFRNLIGCSKPAEGNHAFDHGAALLVRLGGIQQVAQSGGIDPARAYGVDADAPVFQVSRPCARERAHGGLGGAVKTLIDGSPLLATIDALRMMEAPSGSRGSAFCTVKSRPFTLMAKIEWQNSSVMSPNEAYFAT